MTRPSLDGVETAPLLGDRQHVQNGHAGGHPEPEPGRRRPAPSWSRFQAKKPSTIVLLISVVKFLITLSGMMILVPLFRIMEDAFCHRYYDDDSRDMIDERKCKVDGVQREMAYLGGWSAMISAIVGLIVAMPYGILADRIGRKPTFILSYTGIVCSFVYGPCLLWFGHGLNLYLLLTGSLWFLIGGGIIVAMSVLYAMASDVSEEKDRASSFLYLTLGASAGGLLGPIISGKLMEEFGPWVPILIVYCSGPIVFLLIFLIPETLKIEKGAASKKDVPVLQAMRGHVVDGFAELVASGALLKNVNVLLTMVAFFVQNPLVVAYTGILAQYVSKNFGWTLAQTSYLLSPLSLLHLALLAVLPKVSEILVAPDRFFRWSPFMKDQRLAQLSFGFLIVAGLLEGFSHEIVLFLIGLLVGTFGCATSPLCRSIITAHVDPRHTSRLYALLSIVETVGSLFGGPVLAWCFDVGMRKGGLWMGLPWFYVALLCSIALAALFFIRAPPRREGSDEDLVTGEPDAPLSVEP